MSRKAKARTKAVARKQTDPSPPEMPSEPLQEGGHSRGTVAGICAVLAILVLAVFSQTLRHEFVNYDDDKYAYENPAVAAGLSLEGVGWAFTRVHSSNWHPVTWLSHMLDCELYGLAPWGHHLTSVLLHAATAVLLFLALRQLTSAAGRSAGKSLPVRRSSKSEGVWCSAFVAALFAIHPLRVESVAWVAERKDVLSGLFFMLTLLAYERYARLRDSGSRFPVASYLLVIIFFALGLMSKPMVVTLPFVLLLLDYWPLGRLFPPTTNNYQQSTRLASVLIYEKLPLFLMSAASSAVTVIAQTEARVAVEKLPMFWRLGNALAAYVTYLWQTAWPAGLAVMYPHPADRLPLSAVCFSFLILVAVSAVVFALRRKHSYAMTGWLWYLGMLVPVIGLMQVGSQAHADRYTYLPQIGLFIVMAWGAADLSARWHRRRMLCGVPAALVLAILTACTSVQTSYWRDSVTLWTHTIASTSGNLVAHINLGNELALQGKSAEAVDYYLRALEIDPDYVEAHGNLGNVLASQGKFPEAAEHYRSFLQINPNSAEGHTSLGNVLVSQGKPVAAMEHFRSALRIDPKMAQAHLGLGAALAERGEFADAVMHYTEAVRSAPEEVPALNNLGWILATCPEAPLRNGSRAIELARKAERLVGSGNPAVLDTLAAAYAEAGQFPEAVETAGRALDLAVKGNDKALAEEIRQRLQLYESGLPYHEARKR